MIGDRIKQARKSSGLSMRDLAGDAGISAMAISKYERGLSTPSSKVLLSLAKVLNVRVEYFFRQVEVVLEDINYRERDKLPQKEKLKVLADAKDQIERWLELEEIVPTPWSIEFTVPNNLPKIIDDYNQIENVATKVRESWNLGLNPIPDLIDTLESRGIKVFITQYDKNEHFNGLTAKVSSMPIIVIGKTDKWPGDRQRFTLAHELGHLILKGRLSENLDEEYACHRFAGAFLVPDINVFNALGKKRTWLEPQELMLLKNEWGLSMGAWTYRAHNLGILPKIHMNEIWKLFRERGWKEREPDPQYPNEVTRVFAQLIFRAIAEDQIGESKAAELLGMPLQDFHDCRNLERSCDSANQ